MNEIFGREKRKKAGGKDEFENETWMYAAEHLRQ